MSKYRWTAPLSVKTPSSNPVVWVPESPLCRKQFQCNANLQSSMYRRFDGGLLLQQRPGGRGNILDLGIVPVGSKVDSEFPCRTVRDLHFEIVYIPTDSSNPSW